MPKAEAGTPKDIAKRMKAKGLQKLKFWCQMCQKQCRDANGFKCHLTSESHLRQMKLFSEQAGGVLNQYSREFERTYLEVLRVRHTTTEVNANNVYQEVIQDKQHVHMNATVWATLSDFVKYLGKTGKCRVRETDRGWYIRYIEQDAATLAQQEAYRRRQAAEAEAERLESERVERQRAEAAQALDRARIAVSTEATPLDRRDGSAAEPIKVALLPNLSTAAAKKKLATKTVPATAPGNVFGGVDDGGESDDEELPVEPVPLPPSIAASTNKHREASNKRPASGDGRDDRGSYKKVKQNRTEPNSKEQLSSSSTWLLPDILVRIVDPKLKSLDNRKAVVDRVLLGGSGSAAAQITVLDSGPGARDGGQLVELKESQLETVVGKVGKRVVILRGPHRGRTAKTLELNPKKNRSVLELDDGTVLERVRYDDFSKAA